MSAIHVLRLMYQRKIQMEIDEILKEKGEEYGRPDMFMGIFITTGN